MNICSAPLASLAALVRSLRAPYHVERRGDIAGTLPLSLTVLDQFLGILRRGGAILSRRGVVLRRLGAIWGRLGRILTSRTSRTRSKMRPEIDPKIDPKIDANSSPPLGVLEISWEYPLRFDWSKTPPNGI